MRSVTSLAVLALAALTTATLDPATSNTKGKCPATVACSPEESSSGIQAAECSHNTRVAGKQTFAVFVTEHQYDSSHGAPYGSCKAYTCTPPTASEMETDADCWTFFWGDEGAEEGYGTGCIKSPETGLCGCEDSTGLFVPGSSSCV